MENVPKINEKLEKYFALTKKAIGKVKISSKITPEDRKKAEEILDLAKRYYEDARFFEKKNDLVNAFAAVCYAHAFLDIGALMGLFDVDDDQLCMVEKNYRKRH